MSRFSWIARLLAKQFLQSGNGRRRQLQTWHRADVLEPRILLAAPQAIDSFETIRHDSELVSTLNAMDDDSDPLSFAVNSDPATGTVSVGSDGSFTYTPDLGFVGNDSFTFAVSDATDTAVGTLSISVVNNAPFAMHSFDSTEVDQSLSSSIQWGDMDDDSPFFTLITGPSNGTLSSIGLTGSFTYTPNVGFVGQDSFQVDVSDGIASTLASVSIEVQDSGLNPGPGEETPEEIEPDIDPEIDPVEDRITADFSYTQDATQANRHAWGHEFEWKVKFGPAELVEGTVGAQLVNATLEAKDKAGNVLHRATVHIKDLVALKDDHTFNDTQAFRGLKLEMDKWLAADTTKQINSFEFKRSASMWLLRREDVTVVDHGSTTARPFDPESDRQGAIQLKLTVDNVVKYDKAIVHKGSGRETLPKPVFKEVKVGTSPLYKIEWSDKVTTTIVNTAFGKYYRKGKLTWATSKPKPDDIGVFPDKPDDIDREHAANFSNKL